MPVQRSLHSDLRTWMNRTFRRNLRSIREDLGLTQVELAARVGCKQAYICALELGIRAPEIGTVAVLAAALGVSPIILMRRLADDPPPDFVPYQSHTKPLQ